MPCVLHVPLGPLCAKVQRPHARRREGKMTALRARVRRHRGSRVLDGLRLR